MKKSGNVLITGVSSGLGRAIAVDLAKAGMTVFAGVRKEKDKKNLERLNSNIQGLILDLTNAKHVESAFNFIAHTSKERGLSALINNAGINYISPFEFTDPEKELEVLQVNLIGMMRLTRKMMPLLHQNVYHGNGLSNIINVGSIGSIFALPWEASYHASKFAVLGWSESLRLELSPLNIFVSCFLPGGMRTPIFEKSTKKVEFNIPEPHSSYYRKNINHALKTMGKFEKSSSSPEKAAKMILKTLMSNHPPFKVFFGKDAKFIRMMKWLGLSHILNRQFVLNKF